MTIQTYAQPHGEKIIFLGFLDPARKLKVDKIWYLHMGSKLRYSLGKVSEDHTHIWDNMLIFSPFQRDKFCIDLSEKFLGPTQKFYFPPSLPNNTQTNFLSYFLSLFSNQLIPPPTKQTLRLHLVGRMKIWGGGGGIENGVG